MNDASERGNDTAEKIAQFAASDQDVVDIEQNLEAVALLGKLVLVCLGGFEIESVVHGDGYLGGHAFHELNIGMGDCFWQQAAEADGAQATLRGGKRQSRKGTDAGFAHANQKIGEAGLGKNIVRDERLLRLPNPT